ncbi:hypothetical protein C8Q77DRAFT_1080580 [Trametes polyzona]|nr:hypothetical protein C8Q77DRAFT_1080580 [Trametes polyzona]
MEDKARARALHAVSRAISVWDVRFVRGGGGFPRPTFHDAAARVASVQCPNGEIEFDCTCHSPAIGSSSRLHCPRRYILIPRIDDHSTGPELEGLEPAKSAHAPQSVSHRPILRRSFRILAPPLVLTDTDSACQLSCDAFHEHRQRAGGRGRSNRLKGRPYAIKLECLLCELWGLAVPGPKRNEGLWGKGETSGESAVFYAAGATTVGAIDCAGPTTDWLVPRARVGGEWEGGGC